MNNFIDYYDLKMPRAELPENKEMLGDVIRIKSTDSQELRNAMYVIARFFKREFRYDSVQYAAPYMTEDDNECYAYAWTIEKEGSKKSSVVGGFCFRKREKGFDLQWIWLHPYLRNKGFLSKLWPFLKEKFGHDFYVEPPYSSQIEHFLNKEENKIHTFNGGGNKIPYWYEKFNVDGVDVARKK